MSAERFVQTLSLHLKRINETLLRYINLGDVGGSISIQSSNLITLVALAEVYYHLSLSMDQIDRKDEAQDRFLTAIKHVTALAHDLNRGNQLQNIHVYSGVSQDGNFTEGKRPHNNPFLASFPYGWPSICAPNRWPFSKI